MDNNQQIQLSDLFADMPSLADQAAQITEIEQEAEDAMIDMIDQESMKIIEELESRPGGIWQAFYASLGFYREHEDILQPLLEDDGFNRFAARITAGHIYLLWTSRETPEGYEWSNLTAEMARDRFEAMPEANQREFIQSLTIQDIYRLYIIANPGAGAVGNVKEVEGLRSLSTSKEFRFFLHPYDPKTKVGVFRNVRTVIITDDGVEVENLEKVPATIDMPFYETHLHEMYRLYIRDGILPDRFRMPFTDLMKKTGREATRSYIKPDEAAGTSSGITEARASARLRDLNVFENEIRDVKGCLPGDKTEYQLFALLSYNPDTDIIEFYEPYAAAYLMRELSNEISKKGGNYLWHAEVSAKTKAGDPAQEMADYWYSSIRRRGTVPDIKRSSKQNKASKPSVMADERKNGSGKVTYRVTFGETLRHCPHALNALKNETPKRRSEKLKRWTVRAYKMLKDKTRYDLFDRYYQPHFDDKLIPLYAERDTTLFVFTHYGENEGF